MQRRIITTIIAFDLLSRKENLRHSKLQTSKIGFTRLLEQRRLLLSLLVAGLLCAAALMAPPKSSQAQSGASDPDYSKVSDFIGGRKHLLRNDDLLIVSPDNSLNPKSFTFGTVRTKQSAIDREGTEYRTEALLQYLTKADAVRPTVVNGRFFDTKGDTPVILGLGKNFNQSGAFAPVAQMMINVNGHLVSSGYDELSWFNAGCTPINCGVQNFAAAAADFNQDGFDDLVVGRLLRNDTSSSYQSQMRIYTANDLKNPQAGFRLGPTIDLADSQRGFFVDYVATGDFNGDGQPEIAALYRNVFNNGNNNLNLAIFSVDPKTLRIKQEATVEVAAAKVPTSITQNYTFQIAVGQFTAATHQQIIIGTELGDGPQYHYEARIYDFADKSLHPVLQTTWDEGGWGYYSGKTNADKLVMKTGRFFWDSPYDQVAWMSVNQGENNSNNTRLSLLTVHPQTLTVAREADIFTLPSLQLPRVTACYNVSYDLAIGNFDRTDAFSPNPGVPPRNPNLQIAVVSKYFFGNGDRCNTDFGTVVAPAYLSIIDVVPPQGNSAPSFNQNAPMPLTIPRGTGLMTITAADIQGRSYRLGSPIKLTLDSAIQPSAIAAMPPMHVDFVPPANATAPTVFNMTFIPDAFYTQFNMKDTNNSNTTDTHTTSWSFGAKETVSASFEVGDVAKGDGNKFTDTFTAAQKLKGGADTVHGAYANYSYSLQSQTGYGDNVFYSGSRFNIWIYPVIGQTVCPADKPNCQESEKVPLTVQFSAPDQTDNSPVGAGPTLEWYQPPWEPGNLFSYPASLSQLRKIVGMDPLTGAPTIDILSKATTFSADSGKLTQTIDWQNGQTDGSTTSFDANFSFENDFSYTGAGGIPGLATTSGGFDLDISGSYGFSNLHKKVTTMGKSNGITINKPSLPDQDLYTYSISPYIFGKKRPGGVVDEIPLSSDVETFGLLQTAFVVNPIQPNKSTWWDQTYNRPDVALNHPSRWKLTKPALSDPIPRNCLPWGGTSQMECLAKNDENPGDPWTSSFHHMRGLFISSANHPNQGPQLSTARAGEQLALTTRVYNYSLASMPADTEVHARFYGQQWKTTDAGGPSNAPDGNSFLIGETTLNPIPRFDSTDGAPLNWVYAGVKFDTGTHSGKYLTFFVIVWMQKKDGTIVSEMPHHGLNGGFDPKKSITSFADLARFGEDYGNNIGFYNSAFYIFAKDAFLANPSGTPELRLAEVATSSQHIKQGENIEVMATLVAGGHGLNGVTVYFYDGDPAAGGRHFDSERIPHIRPGGRYGLRVRYTANECGQRPIFVTAANGRPYAVTGQSRPVHVECPAPVCVSQVCMRSAQYHALNPGQWPKGIVTVAGGGPGTTVSTSDTAKMKLLLRGGASAQQYFNQQFVATQLNLLGQAGFNQAALRSNLLCYKVNFQPVQLSTGFSLNPSITLGELLDQSRRAARNGGAIDLRTLANVMHLLNGDDPNGRCAGVTAKLFSGESIQKLDALIAQYQRDRNVPGVAVGVWAPGEGEYLKASGVANLATGNPRNATDPFRIASITKTFTATAVLQLVDRGSIGKTDKISKWFPDFPNANLITIDDLLRMRSGIADSFDEEFAARYYENPLLDFPAAESIKLAAGKAAQFQPPNRKTIYTNANYFLLEVIVERVTGRSLGAQITESILKPLGMNNTFYPYDSNMPGSLRGYSLNAGTKQFDDKTVLNPSVAGGAGAMISTLADLRIYARALATGALLKPETQAARLAGQTIDGLPDFVKYGQGIELIGKFQGHNGTIFGSSTEMYYLPEKGAVIVINANRLDLDDHSQSTDLFLQISKLLFPEHVNW